MTVSLFLVSPKILGRLHGDKATVHTVSWISAHGCKWFSKVVSCDKFHWASVRLSRLWLRKPSCTCNHYEITYLDDLYLTNIQICSIFDWQTLKKMHNFVIPLSVLNNYSSGMVMHCVQTVHTQCSRSENNTFHGCTHFLNFPSPFSKKSKWQRTKN